MKKKTTSKKGSGSLGKKVALGAGIAAAAAAAYLLLGPDGKKNRKITGVWAEKMKKELAKRVKQAKELSMPIYNDLVKEVSGKYANITNVDPKELKQMERELKGSWKAIAKEIKKKVASKAKNK